MSWTPENLAKLPVKKGFRLRGESMTRLEVFSDAAFAFALTMLVVSVGTIPNTYDELILAIKSIPAFALCFIQISAFWAVHRAWSRKYGLEGVAATILTLAMIFTILVYVYPLRLIFSSFFDFVSGGWLPSEFKVTDASQIANLFAFYGIGYATLTGVIALLHWHAHKEKEELALSELETLDTRYNAITWSIHCSFGILSALFALLMPTGIAVYSGFVYFFLGVIIPLVARKFGTRMMELRREIGE